VFLLLQYLLQIDLLTSRDVTCCLKRFSNPAPKSSEKSNATALTCTKLVWLPRTQTYHGKPAPGTLCEITTQIRGRSPLRSEAWLYFEASWGTVKHSLFRTNRTGHGVEFIMRHSSTIWSCDKLNCEILTSRRFRSFGMHLSRITLSLGLTTLG
jgi:hypothetical protein